MGEQDGFKGIEEHEADILDEGRALAAREILECGWGSEYVDGVRRNTVFGACMRICWWRIWTAILGYDDFVAFGKENIRELSSNGGSLVVVDLM